MLDKDTVITIAASAAYEAYRLYCFHDGGPLMPEFANAPAEQHYRWLIEVNNIAQIPSTITARHTHETWLKKRQDQGWVQGSQMDKSQKTHPNMVSYDELPEEQRVIGELVMNVVRGVLDAFGYATPSPASTEPASTENT